MEEKEWQTRRKRIDTRLRTMNPPWEIVPWRDGLTPSALARNAVTEFPTANGPDINKSKFVVFDCFDGTLIRYFRNVSSFDIEPPGRTPLTLPQITWCM
ncbi:MAG: hypothetical protein O2960_09500 [Verrucomicrobia bacterium]|nr:hypothetical protein [Verrucomicrobiota bacterium]